MSQILLERFRYDAVEARAWFPTELPEPQGQFPSDPRRNLRNELQIGSLGLSTDLRRNPPSLSLLRSPVHLPWRLSHVPAGLGEETHDARIGSLVEGGEDPEQAFYALSISGTATRAGILIIEDGDLSITGLYRGTLHG